jgi:hypothetical protein
MWPASVTSTVWAWGTSSTNSSTVCCDTTSDNKPAPEEWGQ